ncbi:MAG: Ig-like domain-containing domain, partial [Bacteroidia bacterium]
RGKRLVIQLKEELLASTTYTFNFGNAIKDITENNPIENFTYVISTGQELDSLFIAGEILDVLSGKTADGAFALLYKSDSNTLFTTQKPYYFAKTNKNGNFRIDNIKKGKYQLFALKDQNFNYYYDLPNESIGFIDSAIAIDTIGIAYSLLLFQENTTQTQLLETKPYDIGGSRLIFSNNTGELNIEFLSNTGYAPISIWSNNNDTLFTWTLDSTLLQHQFKISINQSDTMVAVDLKNPPQASVLKKFPINFSSNIPVNLKSQNNKQTPVNFDLNQNLQLLFNRPISKIDTSLIKVKADTIPITDFILLHDTVDSRNVNIQIMMQPQTVYHIAMEKGAFTDIFGLMNDSAHYFIKSKSLEDYGKLRIQTQNNFGANVILELLKDESVVMQNST